MAVAEIDVQKRRDTDFSVMDVSAFFAMPSFHDAMNSSEGISISAAAALQYLSSDCMLPQRISSSPNAICVASSADRNFCYIPKGYEIPTDLDYFHITTNNTIKGTEIKYDMDCPVNLVADMSSDIMSRPVDIKKYALIYGGAQKNA